MLVSEDYVRCVSLWLTHVSRHTLQPVTPYYVCPVRLDLRRPFGTYRSSFSGRVFRLQGHRKQSKSAQNSDVLLSMHVSNSTQCHSSESSRVVRVLYRRYLVRQANKKFVLNTERIRRLEVALRQLLPATQPAAQPPQLAQPSQQPGPQASVPPQELQQGPQHAQQGLTEGPQQAQQQQQRRPPRSLRGVDPLLHAPLHDLRQRQVSLLQRLAALTTHVQGMGAGSDKLQGLQACGSSDGTEPSKADSAARAGAPAEEAAAAQVAAPAPQVADAAIHAADTCIGSTQDLGWRALHCVSDDKVWMR